LPLGALLHGWNHIEAVFCVWLLWLTELLLMCGLVWISWLFICHYLLKRHSCPTALLWHYWQKSSVLICGIQDILFCPEHPSLVCTPHQRPSIHLRKSSTFVLLQNLVILSSLCYCLTFSKSLLIFRKYLLVFLLI
jgi:hypothetical protein